MKGIIFSTVAVSVLISAVSAQNENANANAQGNNNGQGNSGNAPPSKLMKQNPHKIRSTLNMCFWLQTSTVPKGTASSRITSNATCITNAETTSPPPNSVPTDCSSRKETPTTRTAIIRSTSIAAPENSSVSSKTGFFLPRSVGSVDLIR